MEGRKKEVVDGGGPIQSRRAQRGYWIVKIRLGKGFGGKKGG